MVLKTEMHFLPRCHSCLSESLLKELIKVNDSDRLITDKHRQFPVLRYFECLCFIKC